MVDETGTDLDVQIFFGHRINNAAASADFNRRSFQIERTLGTIAGVGVQSEYIVCAVPNTMEISIPAADKVTVKLAFVGKDHETRAASIGVKAGTRPTLDDRDAFNTSSDFSRFRVAPVSEINSFPDALFAFALEMSLSMNNNVEPLKAIANLGAVDMNVGVLQVGGTAEVYFETVDAIAAVRANQSITLDWMIAKNNAGWALDIPLMTLGNGQANIESNQPVRLPLNTQAAKDSRLGYTISMTEFKYLPTVAE